MKWVKRIIIGIVVIVILLFGYYKVWFLRLPDRVIPHDTGVYISPANGIVKAVRPWGTNHVRIRKNISGFVDILTEEVGDSGTIVSIEMNVYHVHYQRAPIKSTHLKSIYTPGKFNNALIQTNEYGMRFENENNVMLFESINGTRYKVVQIAGTVARRIVGYLKEPGKEVEQGEVIGLIKLGSQVTLVFPHTVEVVVEPGVTVIDGETVIARE